MQRCIDSLNEGDTWTIVGVVRAQGLLLKTNNIFITGGGWIKPVSNSAAAVVLTIGDDATSTDVRGLRGHIRIGDGNLATNHTAWSNITGIKVVRAYENVIGLDIWGCGKGLHLAPTATAVSYSSFFLGKIFNNKIGIHADQSGTGYVTDCKFFGGRFGHGDALPGVDMIAVQISQAGDFVPDNIVFYAPTFEYAGKSVSVSGANSCRFLDVRFEPDTDGTAGVNFEDVLVDFRTGTERCEFYASMNTNPWTNNRSVNHGTGTRVNDFTFTLPGDLTAYFYPGALVQLTVSGTTYNAICRVSSFVASTSVTLFHPLVTNTPSTIRTPRINNVGSGNIIRLDRAEDPQESFDVTYEAKDRQSLTLTRSMVQLQSLNAEHPALTLARGEANTDRVLRTMDSTGETSYILANGTQRVSAFGLSVTPVGTQSTIADPAGGATVDAEARTAINTIIDRLQAFGLIS